MKTNELLSKKVLTRDEKIAHLRKLGLWREYCKEVKKADLSDSRTLSTLESSLNGNANWSLFIYDSFAFVHTDKGYDFWSYVSLYGKRPDAPKRKPITIYDFDFTLVGYGRYKVTYTNPSGREYTATITDMTVIDATKNSDSPKVKDLKELRNLCITNNYL